MGNRTPGSRVSVSPSFTANSNLDRARCYSQEVCTALLAALVVMSLLVVFTLGMQSISGGLLSARLKGSGGRRTFHLPCLT